MPVPVPVSMQRGLLAVIGRAALVGVGVGASVGACASAPPPRPPPPPRLEELSLGEATVTRAQEAPPTETTEGSALTQAVQRALDAQHRAVAACYETVLHHHADAAGHIAVEVWFGATGAAQRVQTRVEGEGGGVGTVRGCVENALRAARLGDAPGHEVHVRRTYAFVNPARELTVSAAEAVHPPERRAATAHTARGNTGGVSAAPGGVAIDPAAPPSSDNGVLGAEDVVRVVHASAADLSRCYGTVLRGNHNAAGHVTVDVEIAPDGAVTAATLSAGDPGVAGIDDCLLGVVRALHFRTSGTRTTAHVPFDFAR